MGKSYESEYIPANNGCENGLCNFANMCSSKQDGLNAGSSYKGFVIQNQCATAHRDCRMQGAVDNNEDVLQLFKALAAAALAALSRLCTPQLHQVPPRSQGSCQLSRISGTPLLLSKLRLESTHCLKQLKEHRQHRVRRSIPPPLQTHP